MGKRIAKTDCPRCDGSGFYAGFGVCYRCNGAGKVNAQPVREVKVGTPAPYEERVKKGGEELVAAADAYDWGQS